MEKEWIFSFIRSTIPNRAVILNLEKAESLLIHELQNGSRDKQEVRSELIAIYGEQRNMVMAERVTKEFMAEAADDETRAWAWLKFGQIREQISDFEGAVTCYGEIVRLAPTSRTLRYFAQNNTGYSLNQLGRYPEAEEHCRLAIGIDPRRYNAHKNLAVSLEHQGLFEEAVKSYITSIRCDASDPRALNHLEDLLCRHGALYSQIDDLKYQMHKCRQAVLYARCVNEARN
jgi:tetratricopeptide (TPR) repeat protein